MSFLTMITVAILAAVAYYAGYERGRRVECDEWCDRLEANARYINPDVWSELFPR